MNGYLRRKCVNYARSIQLLFDPWRIFNHHRVGQHGDGAQLAEKTIEVYERLLGTEHPSTLKSMCNLAGYCHSHGQYERAVQLGKQTVEVQKRALGAEHPSTLECMRNIIKSYNFYCQYKRGSAVVKTDG